MQRKALMGIEYTLVIGVVFLLLTISNTPPLFGLVIDPDPNPNGGSNGNGGDIPPVSTGGGGSTGPIDSGEIDINTFSGVSIIPHGSKELIELEPEDVTITVKTVEIADRSKQVVEIGVEDEWDTMVLGKIDPDAGAVMVKHKTKQKGYALELTLEVDAVSGAVISFPEITSGDTFLINSVFNRVERDIIEVISIETNIDNLKESRLRIVVPPEDIVEKSNPMFTRVNSDGSYDDFLATEIEEGTYELVTTSFSLWVFNMVGVVTAPSFCDNDGICEPENHESLSTCPSDCITTAPDQDCVPQNFECIGSKRYQCQPNGVDRLEIENCEFGCTDGACLQSPSSFGVESIYLVAVVIVIVLGLVVAATFLR